MVEHVPLHPISLFTKTSLSSWKMKAVLSTLDDKYNLTKKTLQKQLSVTSMSAASIRASQESCLERSKCIGTLRDTYLADDSRPQRLKGWIPFPHSTRRNVLSKIDFKLTWMIWSLLIIILVFINGVSLDLVELCCFTNHCGSHKPN